MNLKDSLSSTGLSDSRVAEALDIMNEVMDNLREGDGGGKSKGGKRGRKRGSKEGKKGRGKKDKDSEKPEGGEKEGEVGEGEEGEEGNGEGEGKGEGEESEEIGEEDGGEGEGEGEGEGVEGGEGEGEGGYGGSVPGMGGQSKVSAESPEEAGEKSGSDEPTDAERQFAAMPRSLPEGHSGEDRPTIDEETARAIVEEAEKHKVDIGSRLDDYFGSNYACETLLRLFARSGATKILEKIVKPFEAEPRSRLQSLESGLYMRSVASWDVQMSISTYGRLFPETEMGVTRTMIDRRGPFLGKKSGHIILGIDRSGSNEESSEEYNFKFGQYVSVISFALAMLKEAKNRGDYVSLLFTPRYSAPVIKKSKNYDQIEKALLSTPIHPYKEFLSELWGHMTSIVRSSVETEKPQAITLGDFADYERYFLDLDNLSELSELSDCYVLHLCSSDEDVVRYGAATREVTKAVYVGATTTTKLHDAAIAALSHRLK